MRYMGSKRRIAKYILPIILKDRKPNQYYVEPFCGGCNTLDKVDNPRIGSDSHYYLMEMWKAVSKGWIPRDDYSEVEYRDMRINPDKYDPWEIGYCGFALSYGAMWFHTFSKDSANKRNYVGESYRNSLKQFPDLEGIEFYHCSYEELEIPNNSIIYCDPPYKDRMKYDQTQFDHNHFFNWCREKRDEGHIVYVSEYQAPDNFEVVWEKEIASSLTKNTGAKKGTEKLFKLN